MSWKTIGQGALCVALTVAVVFPVSAQDEPATWDGEPTTMAAASAAALTRALEAAPSVLWPDAPAPRSVARYVPLVRERLWSRSSDRLLWPLHLRFVEARCSSDGAVALVYEEIRPLFPLGTYAVAWRTSMPTSADDSWGSGTGISSVLDDPEFTRVMGADSSVCP